MTDAQPSIFEKINSSSAERKAAAWAVYQPLTRSQLFDSLIDEPPSVVLGMNDDKAPARSTLNGAMYAQVMIILRPTEILAVCHALGLLKFDSDDPVVRQEPNVKKRWCIKCGSRPLDMFGHNKHVPSGIAFMCKSCHDSNRRGVWRKSGDKFVTEQTFRLTA